ncbi:INT6A-like protein [Mya arenaria]|uniref:INT6A-like protein n=1 Tax=Mya arenaria TaxID=6604 RepID=A0ABY7G4R9_MYAAR|nr:INT6A-like protein [Mya arenaria]
MTIILFLVDTSASMNQRTYLGTSLIDIAKGSVENFMKIRGRDPNSRWDRYMLLTLDHPPSNIKAGWKESHATFTSELKNLSAGGVTTLGNALKSCFDLLNVNRMQSGIDTYGQGRCPHFLEPAVIIVLTDSGKLTASTGLNIPMNTSCVPGHELTKEPFRWDQRIFGLVMRIPGSVPIDLSCNTFIPPADNHPVDIMCEVTGGRSYAVYNQKMLNAAIDSLVSKVQNGVVIQFEKIGPDPPPLLPDGIKMENGLSIDMKENLSMNGQIVKMEDEVIKVAPTAPLPSQLPGNTSWHNLRRLVMVPRSAQKGYSVGHWPIPEPFWPDNTNQTLVFISNSAKYSELGHPFGYLKASSTLSSVNLFVMPYNYPVLLPLLDELFKPLKRALARMGAHNLVPDNMDNCLSYSVITYLKKLKNLGKMEMDRLVASVGSKAPPHEGIKVCSRTKTSVLQRKDFSQLLKNEYLKKVNLESPALRPLENTPTRVHMFGNPFKVNKNIMVDEAEDSMLTGQQSQKKRPAESPPSSPGPSRKRKPGPLPKDFRLTRKRPPGRLKEEDGPPLSPISEMSEPESELTNHIKVEENGRSSPDYSTHDIKLAINRKNNRVNNKKDAGNGWTDNSQLRALIVKEIRKPGKRYDTLFEHMNRVQGSFEIRHAFVREIIHEAARFKKKFLIDLLQQFETSLIKHSKNNKHR